MQFIQFVSRAAVEREHGAQHLGLGGAPTLGADLAPLAAVEHLHPPAATVMNHTNTKLERLDRMAGHWRTCSLPHPVSDSESAGIPWQDDSGQNTVATDSVKHRGHR